MSPISFLLASSYRSRSFFWKISIIFIDFDKTWRSINIPILFLAIFFFSILPIFAFVISRFIIKILNLFSIFGFAQRMAPHKQVRNRFIIKLMFLNYGIQLISKHCKIIQMSFSNVICYLKLTCIEDFFKT